MVFKVEDAKRVTTNSKENSRIALNENSKRIKKPALQKGFIVTNKRRGVCSAGSRSSVGKGRRGTEPKEPQNKDLNLSTLIGTPELEINFEEPEELGEGMDIESGVLMRRRRGINFQFLFSFLLFLILLACGLKKVTGSPIVEGSLSENKMTHSRFYKLPVLLSFILDDKHVVRGMIVLILGTLIFLTFLKLVKNLISLFVTSGILFVEVSLLCVMLAPLHSVRWIMRFLVRILSLPCLRELEKKVLNKSFNSVFRVDKKDATDQINCLDSDDIDCGHVHLL
ncbi:TPA_asm: G [Zanthoxylum betacytorhabdovirus 2]|nr:TPA_asm: G [Zanthoxilum betacytorhabdovirus 2]